MKGVNPVMSWSTCIIKSLQVNICDKVFTNTCSPTGTVLFLRCNRNSKLQSRNPTGSHCLLLRCSGPWKQIIAQVCFASDPDKPKHRHVFHLQNSRKMWAAT